MFRQMWEILKSGDILLGDRLYDAYRDIVLLNARGIDVVFGKKQSRRIDFRSGRKLGRTLINQFALPLRRARGAEAERLEAELLIAIAHNRVGNRPGRKEPRAVKKCDQKYKYLTKPRDKARKGLPA